MGESYFVAEIKKGASHKVFLFEVEGKETIEEVVEKNFGSGAIVVKYRVPTAEELILMRRSMKS